VAEDVEDRLEALLRVDVEATPALGHGRRAAVALRERAEALEALDDGRAEAALAAEGRHEELVLGRRDLVRPVGPAHLLDRLVRGPGQLERDVDAAALVLDARRVLRVERDARRRRVGDDGHELAAGLELLALVDVLLVHGHAVLRALLVDVVALPVLDDARGAARHLRDAVEVAELLEDDVERVARQVQRVDALEEALDPADAVRQELGGRVVARPAAAVVVVAEVHLLLGLLGVVEAPDVVVRGLLRGLGLALLLVRRRLAVLHLERLLLRRALGGLEPVVVVVGVAQAVVVGLRRRLRRLGGGGLLARHRILHAFQLVAPDLLDDVAERLLRRRQHVAARGGQVVVLLVAVERRLLAVLVALRVGLARRLEADDDALAVVERGPGELHERRHLEARDEAAEEALVAAPEGRVVGLARLAVRAREGPVLVLRVLGDRRHLRELGLAARVEDLPELGRLVVLGDLLRRQRRLDDVEGRARVAQRAAEERALALEVERAHLHGADAPELRELDEVLDGVHRVLVAVRLAGRERRPRAPQAEPRHVAVVPRLRDGRRGAVDDARAREQFLDLEDGLARRRLRARHLGDQILRAVRLVEEEAAVEVLAAAPRDDLVEARGRAALDGLGGAALAQAAVGAEEHARVLLDDRLLLRGQLEDEDLVDADVAEVARGVLVEVDVRRDPDVLLAALEHVLEDEPRELAALAHARAVSEEEARARARREVLVVALAGVGDELELEVAEAALLDDLGPLLGELERVGDGRRRDRRERAVFHRVARVALHALDLDDAGRVCLVAHVLLDGLRLVALAARLLVVVVVVVVDGRRVREVDVLHAHVDVVALHLHELRLRVAVDLALRLAHFCCACVCVCARRRGDALRVAGFGGAARGGAGLSCGAESYAAEALRESDRRDPGIRVGAQ